MELFQELVFTISFSLIVSLLIAKLFAAASSCDDGDSTVSVRVVCDYEKVEKDEDPVDVGGEVDFGYVDGKLGSGVVVEDVESVRGVGVCQVFDEMPERTELNDAGVDMVESDKGNVVEGSVLLIQENCVKGVDVQRESSTIDEEDEVFDDDDDDWQGIETTELEKSFGAAVTFMDSKSGADRVNLIDNEVKIQLYGLHKVAIEGSCFEPQPLALKVSARANWNSWKRFENLGREEAMEQYIALLSQHVPDWMGKQ